MLNRYTQSPEFIGLYILQHAKHMIKITLSEYNALHKDYRGVWTIERDDLPNWAEIRDKHMGKRTMLHYDSGATRDWTSRSSKAIFTPANFAAVTATSAARNWKAFPVRSARRIRPTPRCSASSRRPMPRHGSAGASRLTNRSTSRMTDSPRHGGRNSKMPPCDKEFPITRIMIEPDNLTYMRDR